MSNCNVCGKKLPILLKLKNVCLKCLSKADKKYINTTLNV